METKSNDHSGHRKRLRNQFLSDGLIGLTDQKALELLLCFAIPRRDVMPLVEELLKRFGSYLGVLQASPDQLRQVKGISDNTIALTMLLCQSMSLYGPGRAHINREHRSYFETQAIALFEGRTNEALYLMGLDANMQILHLQFLCEQTATCAELPLRKIVAAAISMDVNTVVLCHNHPSGATLPSSQDVSSTIALQNALNTVNIHLADHYIISGGHCISVCEFILDNL